MFQFGNHQFADAQTARNFHMQSFHQFDAQAAMAFVISQTAYIEPQVYQTVYPDIQYPMLIPVDTNAPAWVKTITYYSGDHFGRAKWINGNADDIPMAGAELNKFETTVHMAAIGYGFGLEEIRQAQMLGYPLESTNAAAARRAYEEFVDASLFVGATEKNFSGFINHPAVTPAAAAIGDWGGTGSSPDDVLTDINDALGAVWTGTNFTSIADTILLPYSKLIYATSARIPNTAETMWSYVQRNNIYTATTGRPLVIRGVRGLDTAGAGGITRMIAYRRSPEVLKAHIPLPLMFLPVFQASPLRWEIPGIFRFGGLDIRLPAEVRYRDGI
jgi:hypothetical protein